MHYEIFIEGNFQYLRWQGQHTIGENGCRGTEIHIRPSSLILLPMRQLQYHNLLDINNIGEFFRNVEEKFPNVKDDQLFIEDFSIRGQNIPEIISILECTSAYYATREDLIGEAGEDFTDYIFSLGPTNIIVDGNNYILPIKINDIIDELNEVHNYALSQNITFHWI